MNAKFLVKNGIFLSVFLGAALLPYQEVIAQGDRPLSTPDRRVTRELWDIWRQGFEFYEKGEMKMISGKYAESLPLYQKSLESFQEVRRQNPQWNRNVIEYRMNLCKRRLLTAQRRAAEASDAAKRALNRSSITLPASGSAVSPSHTATTAEASRELDRRLQNAIQENSLRKKQIEELQKELAQLRPDAARADSALRQIRSLMEERTKLEKQLASIKLQFEKIQEEQRKSSPRTAELERLLSAEQNKSSAYAKAFRERSAEHAVLQEQLKTLKAEQTRRDAAYAELNRKYTVELQSTEKMVRQNAAQLNTLSAAVKKSEEENLRLKNSLEKKNREYEQSVAELGKLRAGQLSSDELSRKIAADAAVLREENRKSKAELETLRSSRAHLENQMADLNREIIKLKKDLILNIEQRNDFAKANDSISKQFGELERSFRKLSSENAELRKKLDAAVRERELLASKVNDQLSESLKNQLAAARLEIGRLTAEREAAEKTGNQRSESLKNQLAAAQLEIGRLTAEQKAAEKVKLQNESLARLTEELKNKNDQLAKLNSETEQLRILQNDLTAKLRKADSENAELRSQQTQLVAQMAKQRRDSENAVQSGEAARQQLQAQLKAQEEAGKKPSALVIELRRQLTEAEGRNKVLQQENSALKSESDVHRKQLSDTRNKTDSLQQENASLKKESAELRRKLADSENSREKPMRTVAPAPVPVPIPVSRPVPQDYQEKYTALEKKYAALQNHADETGRQLADARSRNETLTRQLADSNRKALTESRQASEKIQELTQTKTALAQQQRDLTNARSKLSQYRKTTVLHEKQRLELLQEISQLQNTLRATAAERTRLGKELDAAREKLPTAGELERAQAERARAQQTIARMQQEKTELETNIASLQSRLGGTQAQLAKLQKNAAENEKYVMRLRNSLLELEKNKNELTAVRKDLDTLQKEKNAAEKNAAVMEQNLKSELQKNARQILTLREENISYRETVRTLTERRDHLEKDLSQASAQIEVLKKQLAKALSEEEKIQLKKRIAELTETMRKLSSGSEDELVREAAAKNVVISDLLKEQEAGKAEIRKLNQSVESYRILALRQKEIAEKAEETSKIALYDARKTRGELKMLQADIVDGIVHVPEARRQELAVRKRKRPIPEDEKAVQPQAENKVEKAAQPEAVQTEKAVAFVKASQGNASEARPAETPEKTEKEPPLPKEYQDAMNKGAEAEKAGDLGMALWHYWQAADMAEKQSAPYFALAKLHLKRKELDSALKAYEKAIKNGGSRDPAFEKELTGNNEK
ncbi:MAG: hypothetical protein J5858_11785 [Lentisphaeria bacterium]|nr:hypothetical protein [Lentisphaeria bacterium]